MDVTKLPKWAQDKIRTLEETVSDLEAALECEHSRVSYRLCDKRVFIPTATFYQFQMRNTGDRIMDAVSVYFLPDDPETLCISGGDAIVVEPRSSNLIYIRMKQRGGKQ